VSSSEPFELSDQASASRLDSSHELPAELASALDRLDELVMHFERHPEPAVGERVVELLQRVDTIHRAGLRRLDALLKAAGLQRRALADPEVRLLFDLYDLGEGGERRRASAVLDTVRPYIESHGGELEVIEAHAGVIAVRLSGACSGCQGAAGTLRHGVEQALREGMPGFVRLEVLEATPAGSAFVPLSALPLPPRPRLSWHLALPADEVPVDAVWGVEVEGRRVLIANLEGELRAYTNACPGTALALDAGAVSAGTITCPWHGCRFDLRGGRRLDAAGPGLAIVPIAVRGGEVCIGILEETVG
jgi:Fe-S cluster biogenesis protein NfuA/nitrite reductase/ring-hydroxylating ferredoxin subunit